MIIMTEDAGDLIAEQAALWCNDSSISIDTLVGLLNGMLEIYNLMLETEGNEPLLVGSGSNKEMLAHCIMKQEAKRALSK